MLLRSLPDLTSASGEFRQRFHAKWGRENCVVLGRSRRADFGPCTHTLSIRAAWGGTEYCHVGGRTLGIDDDCFLILNHGRVYSTSIHAPWPVQSLSICFRPGLVEETAAAMTRTLDQALDDGTALEGALSGFAENLQPHNKLVSPVLRFIKVHLLQGVDDEAWYEEQLQFLLERMQAHRARALRRADELRLMCPARRRELFRRIALATDFLQTNYARALDLDEVARVACLSKYHFLRLFTRVHGITPVAYLQRKRSAVAARLLRTTQLTVNEVASSVGFPERTTLLRQIRRWTGFSPRQLREARIPRRLPRPVVTVD